MNPGAGERSFCVPENHAGMVLLFCLIFLTALSLLGLSAFADTVLQNQLFANLQENERAKQSALTTLSWAETWLLELDSPTLEICTEPCDGLKIHGPGDLPPQPEFEDISWWSDHGHEAGLDPITGERISTTASSGIDPRLWIIEVIHTIPASENPAIQLQVWYRIMARGNGRTKAVVSVIESIVVRSWPSSDNNQLPGAEISDTCPDSGSAKKCGRVAWRELR